MNRHVITILIIVPFVYTFKKIIVSIRLRIFHLIDRVYFAAISIENFWNNS